MKYTIILVFTLGLLSCSDDDIDSNTLTDLNGMWVEVETRSDTLTFESWDGLERMILSRGKEMRDGNLLPKPGSGPYVYKLSEEKISLYWILSSNSNFNDYSFQVIGNRLEIGDFYGSTSKPTLTFEKLD